MPVNNNFIFNSVVPNTLSLLNHDCNYNTSVV